MSINHPHKTKYKACKIVGFVFLGIVFAVGFALLFSFAVVYLWNWLMVDLFSLPTITYLQAFGIIILAKILFGGFGHHNHRKDNSHFHNRFKEKFDNDCSFPDTDDENIGDDMAYLFRHKHLLKKFWQEKGREEFRKYKESCCSDKKEE